MSSVKYSGKSYLSKDAALKNIVAYVPGEKYNLEVLLTYPPMGIINKTFQMGPVSLVPGEDFVFNYSQEGLNVLYASPQRNECIEEIPRKWELTVEGPSFSYTGLDPQENFRLSVDASGYLPFRPFLESVANLPDLTPYDILCLEHYREQPYYSRFIQVFSVTKSNMENGFVKIFGPHDADLGAGSFMSINGEQPVYMFKYTGGECPMFFTVPYYNLKTKTLTFGKIKGGVRHEEGFVQGIDGYIYQMKPTSFNTRESLISRVKERLGWVGFNPDEISEISFEAGLA